MKGFASLITLSLIVTNAFAAKILVADDYVYESSIKTVLLYPTNPQGFNLSDMVTPPMVSVRENLPLQLEFDELGTQQQNYSMKVINCNYDWSISQLNPIQYLNEFNEYQITDRQNSYNTRIAYVHYKTLIPKINISGNYLLVVYRNTAQDDIIITRRIVVFNSQLAINMEPKFPMAVSERYTGQQIDVFISNAGMNLVNPLQNLHLVLRQNYRWDSSIKNLKPSYFNESAGRLEYVFFNKETLFNGYNEFRFFDIRSNRFSGQGVARAIFDLNKTEVVLGDDINKSMIPYSLVPDFMDGRYLIQHYESGDNEVQPDYVFVTFVLNSAKVNGEVYIIGSMTDWKAQEEFKMSYNTAINKYTCRVLLKQGQYNYRYALTSKQGPLEEWFFEGSHNITQNVYDVLAYYRPFGGLSDQVIGYKKINYQGR